TVRQSFAPFPAGAGHYRPPPGRLRTGPAQTGPGLRREPAGRLPSLTRPGPGTVGAARSSPTEELPVSVDVMHAPSVALVTGAARGSGAATVAARAADGWRVVAVDRCADDPALPNPLGSRAELDRVVAAVPEAVAVEADVRDPDALAAAVRLAGERWGGL